MPLILSFVTSLLVALIVSLTLSLPLTLPFGLVTLHKAEAGISFGLGSDYINLPHDFEAEAIHYVVNELGYPADRIGNVQLLAIRRGRVEDIITRVQAVVRFNGPVVDRNGDAGPGAVVVIMRRSGSVVSHFDQR